MKSCDLYMIYLLKEKKKDKLFIALEILYIYMILKYLLKNYQNY